ncbi:hemolytic lectin [Mycena leptocephala]|nr:hemolytic lectin [Mycena leptocephala]
MSDFYIPPANIFFRLIGNDTARALFSRSGPGGTAAGFGAHPANDVLTSSWFSLVRGTGNRDGLFAIRGRESGWVLYSRTARLPLVGHDHEDGRYDDNWFRLQPGTGTWAGMVCLVVPSTNTVIVLRASDPTFVTNYEALPGVVGRYSDQFFALDYEDMIIDRIEYNLSLGRIISNTPKVLASQTLHNQTSQPQQMIFEMSESVTHTSSFEFSRGITLSVGVTMSGGIPFIFDTEIRVDASSTETRTYGKEESITKTYTATFPVNAGPYSSVRAVSRVNSGILDVPYTLHLRSRSTNTQATSHGTWRGVSTWELTHTLTDILPDGTEREHREVRAEAERENAAQ